VVDVRSRKPQENVTHCHQPVLSPVVFDQALAVRVAVILDSELDVPVGHVNPTIAHPDLGFRRGQAAVDQDDSKAGLHR